MQSLSIKELVDEADGLIGATAVFLLNFSQFIVIIIFFNEKKKKKKFEGFLRGISFERNKKKNMASDVSRLTSLNKGRLFVLYYTRDEENVLLLRYSNVFSFRHACLLRYDVVFVSTTRRAKRAKKEPRCAPREGTDKNGLDEGTLWNGKNFSMGYIS